MSTHNILVTLDNNSEFVVAHFPKKAMFLDDTLRCHTDTAGGVAEIYFDVNGSPFGTTITEIDSNDPPQELKVKGTFTGRCKLTVGKVIHIYPPVGPKGMGTGGGNVIVRGH
jgi:hypothetical protein